MDETSTPDSSTMLDQLLKMFAANLSDPNGPQEQERQGTAMDTSGAQFGPARALQSAQGAMAGIPGNDVLVQLLEALNPINWMGSPAGGMAAIGAPASRTGLRLAGASASPRPGVINPTVRGSQVPLDPWGAQRQSMSRGGGGQPPAAAPGSRPSFDTAGAIELPRNPRDVSMSAQSTNEYNRLPRGGRSQNVPEDFRRMQAGEQLPPLFSQPSGRMQASAPAGDTYRFFQELAKKLGIEIQ